jgi:hypothetical protein
MEAFADLCEYAEPVGKKAPFLRWAHTFAPRDGIFAEGEPVPAPDLPLMPDAAAQREVLLDALCREIHARAVALGILPVDARIIWMRGGKIRNEPWLLRYLPGGKSVYHTDEYSVWNIPNVRAKHWLSVVAGVRTHGESLNVARVDYAKDSDTELLQPEPIASGEFIVFPSRFSHGTDVMTEQRTIFAAQFCVQLKDEKIKIL